MNSRTATVQVYLLFQKTKVQSVYTFLVVPETWRITLPFLSLTHSPPAASCTQQHTQSSAHVLLHEHKHSALHNPPCSPNHPGTCWNTANSKTTNFSEFAFYLLPMTPFNRKQLILNRWIIYYVVGTFQHSNTYAYCRNNTNLLFSIPINIHKQVQFYFNFNS